MPEFHFAIPGDIDQPTGGYGYDRRVLAELPAQGIDIRHMRFAGTFPLATVPDLGEAGYLLKSTPEDAVIMVDGLAYGALTDLVLKDIDRAFVALVHHPLAEETGLAERRRRAFRSSERSALARAAHVVVTSAATGRMLLDDYGVTADRLTVAEPGTDPAARAKGSGGAQVHVLCVGSLLPRKGYRLLVDALDGLRDLPWRCTIVGSATLDPAEAEAVRAQVETRGLGGRIRFAGPMSAAELAACYAEADLFAMPSLYEGYGMALAEAMARGLPIVCTTGGALAETVPDDAALKVAPGEAAPLREALRRAIGDGALRQRLAEGSWQAGTMLPRWTDTARRIADVLRAVAESRAAVAR